MNELSPNLPAVPDVEPVTMTAGSNLVKVVIFSFGYLWHTNPSELATTGNCEVLVDVRDLLYNPFHDPAMRELTGLDPRVQDFVLRTPGARELVASVAGLALTAQLQVDGLGKLVEVGFGCAGGRHRSVVLANMLGHMLNQAGVGAEVTHYDVLRPVWRRPGGDPR
jgi:UPF0042 nucleotide-binding protein